MWILLYFLVGVGRFTVSVAILVGDDLGVDVCIWMGFKGRVVVGRLLLAVRVTVMCFLLVLV